MGARLDTLRKKGIWPKYKPLDYLKRSLIALASFCLIAISNVMSLNADLGARPDNSLYVDISNHTGLTVGQASQIFTLAIIVINLFFRIYPALGTLMDMFFVGYFMDWIMALGWLPMPVTLLGKLVLLVLSVPVLAIGVGLYMNMKIGEGPRDGLMLALSEKYHWKISTVRVSIDVLLLAFAFLLGGPIGIGTVLLAVLPGFFVERALKAFVYPFKKEYLKAFFTNRLPEETEAAAAAEEKPPA